MNDTFTLDRDFGPAGPTNTPPTAADNTVTTDEDTAYTFDAADFNFSDVDTGATLASVKITGLETAGALQLSGADVTQDQVITTADIDADNLTFTPAANANGDPYATFRVQRQRRHRRQRGVLHDDHRRHAGERRAHRGQRDSGPDRDRGQRVQLRVPGEHPSRTWTTTL